MIFISLKCKQGLTYFGIKFLSHGWKRAGFDVFLMKCAKIYQLMQQVPKLVPKAVAFARQRNDWTIEYSPDAVKYIKKLVNNELIFVTVRTSP